MASRLNFPLNVALDTNGDPISGAKLNFYEPGTTTPLDTYSEETLTTANANPVVADSAGRFGDIFLKPQDYKVVLTDASDVTIDTWDPVGPESVTPAFQDISGSLAATGSSNAYVLATNQVIGALAAGQRLAFIANHANTGAATLAVDGLVAKAIKKRHDVALISGDIEVDQIIDVVYKATEDVWQMQTPAARVEVERLVSGSKTASASASLDYTAGITTDYQYIDFTLINVIVATDAAELLFRVSDDAGVSFEAGTGYVQGGRLDDENATSSANNSAGTSGFVIAFDPGTDTNEAISGHVRLYGPGTARPFVTWNLGYTNSSADHVHSDGSGRFVGNGNAIDAVQFIASAGNLESGTIIARGFRA